MNGKENATASPAVSSVNAILQPTTPKAVGPFLKVVRNVSAAQGSPQTSLPQKAILFSPGVKQAFVWKDANGKMQVVNVRPAPKAASQVTPVKVQPVQPGASSAVRPLVPQQISVSMPVTPVPSGKTVYNNSAGSPATSTILRPVVIPKGVAISPSVMSRALALSQNAALKNASRPPDGGAVLRPVNQTRAPGGGAVLRPVIQKGIVVNPNALSQNATVTANQGKFPYLRSTATAVPMGNSVAPGILRPRLVRLQAPGLAPNQRLVAPLVRPVILKQINSATNIVPQELTRASSSVLHGTLNTVSTVNGRKRIYLPPPSLTSTQEEGKKIFCADSLDEDIIDVVAMGGVNLEEETQRMLYSNSDSVRPEIRSCENVLRERFLDKIAKIGEKYGVQSFSDEALSLICLATEDKLRDLLEKMFVVAHHRLQNKKKDESTYDISNNAEGQLRFIEDLGRLQKKKQEEAERETFLKSTKKRSKLHGREQRKLTEKAEEMQRAAREEERFREMNMTALHALGPAKKKQKTNSGISVPSQVRPREKYVNIRDLQFVLEQEKHPALKQSLYKSYFK